MKKTFLLIGILCAGFASCTDDDIVKGNGTPAEPGDEIRFAAFQQASEMNDTDNPGSRAHYGLYTLNEEEGKYSIYWDNGDNIAVYCPQAKETKPEKQDKGRETDYKIVLDTSNGDENTMQSGTLDKINPEDIGLQWGPDDIHDFFGFFPKDAKEGIILENGLPTSKLKLTLPVLQTPSAMRVIAPNSGIDVTLPNGETVTGKTYIARPDMDNCFMYAHSQGSRVANEQISLTFNPIVTTMEFVIRGPESGEPIEVSQVVLSSERNICGSFSLQIGELNSSEDGVTETLNDGTLSNTVTIPVYYNHNVNSEGVGATTGDNLEPVTLYPGDVLVVRAFILPNTIATTDNNAVTVHMVGSGTKTKMLKGGTIEPKTINIATLPYLEKSPTNYWMTMLDKNVYFSQLSIPGTHNSYNYAAYSAANFPNDNSTMGSYYQTKTIKEQLEAGARAFSFQVGFENNSTTYNNAVKYAGWQDDTGYPLYVYAGGGQTHTTLTDVLSTFVSELNALNDDYKVKYPTAEQYGRESQEFIVLNITYNQRGDRSAELPRWLKAIDYAIDNYSDSNGGAEMLTNEIDANTTIADLAKKIVIFVNYQGSSWPDEEIKEYTTNWWGTTTETGNVFQYSYTPKDDAEKYVVVMTSKKEDGTTLDFSGMNDRDYTDIFSQEPSGDNVGSGVTLWRQNLERLNNTNLTGDNFDWLGDRQTTKKNMIASLFKKAVDNNKEGIAVGNWYINNLGSFCVVNNSSSYGTTLGESGNVVMAANLMNQYAYQYLSNSANNSAPCGVVLMNLFGESNVNGLDVYSTALQQIIIENNYRFALKVRE
ncbi:MAG: hypothetical protein Q4D36_10400 [Bacteroidales bacterium]|nr:hypothetical protein [Bacteroidales bacterium]